MYLHLFTCILLQSFLFSSLNTEVILSKMFDDSGWDHIRSHSDSLHIFKKRIHDIDLPAFKAELTVSTPYPFLVSAILDGENHDKFMETSHVAESTVLKRTESGESFLYQMLDLPFVRGRHYITRNYTDTLRVGSYRHNWRIDSDSNKRLFSETIEQKAMEHGNPIFIEMGAGSWIVESIDSQSTTLTYVILIDPGGWIPDWVVNYAVKKLTPDTVLMMAREGRRRFNESN